MQGRRSIRIVAVGMLAVVGALAPALAPADSLRAVPFVFIGTAAQCGGVAGSHIVTSAWLGGMGLPDNGGPNGDPATANDPHRGVLLNKNGPTTDCSSAGLVITNVPKVITELDFDYRNGTHCGAGAPRFNIETKAGFTYFAGCGDGVHTPATQDPAQWTHVSFSAAGGLVAPQNATNPPFVFGVTEVKRLSIVYDEGTDTVGTEDPNGVGLSNIDNISVNNAVISSGTGIADGTQGNRSKNDDGRDDDNGHGDD
jgi:hypothetical protein